MTAASLLTLMLLGAQGALPNRGAGDLLPESGAFSADRPRQYQQALSDLLLPDDRSRTSALVARSAFEAEWAVYLSGGPSGQQIVVRALRKPLSEETVKAVPARPTDVKFISPHVWDAKAASVAAKFVTQATAPISPKVAGRIQGAWRKALLRVRYSSELERMYAGADGTAYHVSHCTPGCLAGMTWSPEKDSIAGLVVELGEAMRAYVLERQLNRRNEDALGAKAEALVEAIAKLEQGGK